MKSILRIFPLVLFLAGAILLFELPAYGYADPGTGLLAVQAVGSALVAGGWYLRKKIYSLFHRPQAGQSEQQKEPAVDSREGSTLQ
jgi:hypothetical protein